MVPTVHPLVTEFCALVAKAVGQPAWPADSQRRLVLNGKKKAAWCETDAVLPDPQNSELWTFYTTHKKILNISGASILTTYEPVPKYTARVRSAATQPPAEPVAPPPSPSAGSTAPTEPIVIPAEDAAAPVTPKARKPRAPKPKKSAAAAAEVPPPAPSVVAEAPGPVPAPKPAAKPAAPRVRKPKAKAAAADAAESE